METVAIAPNKIVAAAFREDNFKFIAINSEIIDRLASLVIALEG